MSERGSGSRRMSGISRREFLRRGAIVGGTLIWAAPAVQTLAPAAYAQVTPGPCGCCYCWNGEKQNPSSDLVTDDGCTGFLSNPQACSQFCAQGAPGGPFTNSEQCCGTTACEGNTQNDPGLNGCFCR